MFNTTTKISLLLLLSAPLGATTATDVANAGKNFAVTTKDYVVESAQEAGHKVAEGTHAVKEKASDVAHTVADKTSHGAHVVAEKASDGAHAVAHTAQHVGHSVADTGSKVAHAIAQGAHNAVEGTKHAGQVVNEKAHSVGHRIAHAFKAVGFKIANVTEHVAQRVVNGAQTMKTKTNDSSYCACTHHSNQLHNDYEIVEVMVLSEDKEHVEMDERLHQSCETCGKTIPYYPEDEVIILVCKKTNPDVQK